MDTNLIRYLVMIMDYFSAFMLFLILICSVFEKNKTKLLKIYIGMASACTVSLLLEGISLSVALSGIQNGTSIIRLTLNTAAVISGYGLAFFYACYVANLVGAKRRMCQLTIKALQIIGAVSVCFFILGSALGWFYTFENGVLTAAPLFVLLFGFDIIACLAGILLIIRYRKHLNPRDVIGLLTLPSFIFISAALQYISLDMMYALFIMAAFSLFIIYLMIQSDINRQKAEQDKKLMDMNIALMISQIQPHFLYNALSSIRRMIKKNPEVAQTAIENFSLYLRQNLESMNRVEPIPFTTELKHLKEYLYLEKLRFGDRLCVEYEIGYSDFVMPVLSLQPIVENAAKHGILKKEDGGTIWIKTYREGANVILTVRDDGIGFNPEAALLDGRMHIGLNNVKSRIEMQCRGTVKIESELGVGTTVTMTIPLM